MCELCVRRAFVQHRLRRSFCFGETVKSLQQGAAQDDGGDSEIDDEAGDIDEGGDEGAGGGGRIET